MAGNPNYHCKGGQDVVSTLDQKFLLDTARATAATVARALGDTAAPPPRPSTTTCATICAGVSSATEPQINCVVDLVAAMGLPISTTSSCQSIASGSGCTECANDLGFQTGDCSLIAERCLN